MASNQNQGMMVAVIIFVILTVISMGVAVVFVKEAGDLDKRYKVANNTAQTNRTEFEKVDEQKNELKSIILTPDQIKVADDKIDQEPDREKKLALIKQLYSADKEAYANRLALTKGATYSQTLKSAVDLAEDRNTKLDVALKDKKAADDAKEALDQQSKAQIAQFKMLVDAAEKEKTDAMTKLAAAEQNVKDVKLENTTIVTKYTEEINTLRNQHTTALSEKDTIINDLRIQLAKKVKEMEKLKPSTFVATYDGKVTKVNPMSRTVWINLGKYDNLPKNLTFSVQPEGIPPGSSLSPKAKIEVIELLGNHLAEARIIEDDLRTPILPGDNIFTPGWEPGQLTRFGFAGKIDLDGDGSDDMDQVRALVARAGGQIDAEIVNGELRGGLSIETRYLVLGNVPADKAGAAVYQHLLKEAETLGIQRVPMGVFFDQIGYKRIPSTTIYGGSTNNPRALERPDGGAPVSGGVVSEAFKIRKPPAAAGSAY